MTVATARDAGEARLQALLPQGRSSLSIGPAEVDALLAGDIGRPHELVVLRHCCRGRDPLGLLCALDRVLDPAGVVDCLVLDQFVRQRSPEDAPGSLALDGFVELAERLGWTVAHQEPIGGDARAGEHLLHLRRRAAPADRLHPVGPAEARQMQQLFAHVFGHVLSPEQWQWKYGEGRGFALGLSRAGRLIAHYGGSTRQVLWRGRPADACQVCDVMVAPEANEALIRKGPMYQVSASFLTAYLGWGHRHALAYGFPSDRHHALARRLRLYDGVDSVVRAHWSVPVDLPPPRLAVQVLDAQALAPGGRVDAIVQRLWQRMAASFASQIIGVRDGAWLRHRYLAHPVLRYELLLVRSRWTRRPLGVVVLRVHEQHLEVLDLVAPPAAWPALVAVARSRAVRAGSSRVDLWITQSQLQHVAGIEPDAFAVAPLNITVPANIHTPGPVDEVRDRWLLLAGDADFT